MGKTLTKIVQCVEYYVETAEPCDVKLGLLYISMYWSDLDIGVEGRSRLCSDLGLIDVVNKTYIR